VILVSTSHILQAMFGELKYRDSQLSYICMNWNRGAYNVRNHGRDTIPEREAGPGF
jgi:hypothetical protein